MTTPAKRPAVVGGGGATAWETQLGPAWRADLGIWALLIFVAGAITPLGDPDLPLHLALGEWIVQHRAVPMEEPFSWTRAGAPFYAYSWGMAVLYYWVFSAWGALGLRVLFGFLLVSSAVVVLTLARAAGWRPWTALFLAMVNVVVLSFVVAALRPQIILAIAVPLAWASAYRLLDAEKIRWPVAGLLFSSALAANSHLLFPLTAAPWILLFTRPPRQRRRMVAMVAAVVLGWFLSPYALQWPEVFRLNFAANALQVPFSPITEMRPGFLLSAGTGYAAFLLALGFTLLPWSLAGASMSVRERSGFAVCWLIGLLLFTLAARSLLVWWLLVIPIVAAAIERLKEPSKPWARRAQKMLVFVFCLLLMFPRATVAREGWENERSGSRTLSSGIARSIEPLLEWLECHVRPGIRPRVYTTFNFGNYVIWRMPGYSPSIDGRVIFPNSVARAEGFVFAPTGSITYGPWAAADLAIIPLRYRVSAVLDTATGWHRATVTAFEPGDREDVVGLWLKNSWWDRVRVPACSSRDTRPSP